MIRRIGKRTEDWKEAVGECVQMREELKAKYRRIEVNDTKRDEKCQNRRRGNCKTMTNDGRLETKNTRRKTEGSKMETKNEKQ